MKRFIILLVVLGAWSQVRAGTTIDAGHRYAYGANIGWGDWVADTNHGVVVSEYVCSGFFYSANVGWINMGNGAPTNGIQYQNLSTNDFGVNQDGLGNLRGFAYGANIGWISFESNGAPRVDLKTGQLSGYAYSANCGWINLSNAVTYVQTDVITAGADTDGDGIADAWELAHFGNLTTANGTSDYDGDGSSDLSEYRADTDPLDASSYLRITAYNFATGGTNTALTWTSELTRNYFAQKSPDIISSNWTDSGLGQITPDGSSTSRSFDDTNATAHFYRVSAVRPLSP